MPQSFFCICIPSFYPFTAGVRNNLPSVAYIQSRNSRHLQINGESWYLKFNGSDGGCLLVKIKSLNKYNARVQLDRIQVVVGVSSVVIKWMKMNGWMMMMMMMNACKICLCIKVHYICLYNKILLNRGNCTEPLLAWYAPLMSEVGVTKGPFCNSNRQHLGSGSGLPTSLHRLDHLFVPCLPIISEQTSSHPSSDVKKTPTLNLESDTLTSCTA